MTPLLWGFEEREHLMGFYEALALHAAISGPAVCIRICQTIYARYQKLGAKICGFIDDLETLLTENRILSKGQSILA